MENIAFNKSGMFVGGHKVKQYSKSYLLGFDLGNGIDKSIKIIWKNLDGVVIIDEILEF